MVVSLPELRDTVRTGVYKWKELLSSVSTYSELPWERKALVDVATYHIQSKLPIAIIIVLHCLYTEGCHVTIPIFSSL